MSQYYYSSSGTTGGYFTDRKRRRYDDDDDDDRRYYTPKAKDYQTQETFTPAPHQNTSNTVPTYNGGTPVDTATELDTRRAAGWKPAYDNSAPNTATQYAPQEWKMRVNEFGKRDTKQYLQDELYGKGGFLGVDTTNMYGNSAWDNPGQNWNYRNFMNPSPEKFGMELDRTPGEAPGTYSNRLVDRRDIQKSLEKFFKDPSKYTSKDKYFDRYWGDPNDKRWGGENKYAMDDLITMLEMQNYAQNAANPQWEQFSKASGLTDINDPQTRQEYWEFLQNEYPDIAAKTAVGDYSWQQPAGYQQSGAFETFDDYVNSEYTDFDVPESWKKNPQIMEFMNSLFAEFSKAYQANNDIYANSGVTDWTKGYIQGYDW